MRIICLALLVLLLQSCAIATTAEFERQLSNGLVGQNIESVAKEIGYHKDTITAANGNKVYIYEYVAEGTDPGMCWQDSYGKTYCKGSSYYHKWCKFFFEVGRSNIIVNVDLQGDDCPKACSPEESDKFCYKGSSKLW